jgi:hypothetical protein
MERFLVNCSQRYHVPGDLTPRKEAVFYHEDLDTFDRIYRLTIFD